MDPGQRRREKDRPDDLDSVVPEGLRMPWVNWTIGFLELSGVVLFLALFVFLIIRLFSR